ncbi:MAG: DEAD/DEAH box helicase [Desulfosarcina sp.]|jgi:superfamily II DNA or RNA helicase
MELTSEFIRTHIADSDIIFQRGLHIYRHGAMVLKEAQWETKHFAYAVDGNYGDYTIHLDFNRDKVIGVCDCPYPNDGCKHTVAALLDASAILDRWKTVQVEKEPADRHKKYLSAEEIRQLALEDRKTRARKEAFTVVAGETFKGEHLVETATGRQYAVTLHDPAKAIGHCSCPDYLTNRLGTCKHILHLVAYLKKRNGFSKQVKKERFPFIDIYWDSASDSPRLFCASARIGGKRTQDRIADYFSPEGAFVKKRLVELLPLVEAMKGEKRVRIREAVLDRLGDHLMNQQLLQMSAEADIPEPDLTTQLYPYQLEGVRFALYKPAALIGDEMGLGKTLQAIALAGLKQRTFGFEKVLVVTLASLKEQWKREIERFSDMRADIVAGSPKQRKEIYFTGQGLFKITNYEAVLRDVTLLRRFHPDLVILDEAQRIKNFSTKTADAVKHIPRTHALVLTGTPLENKLEDVYSIVQFLAPHMLAPLWKFAANHFMLARDRKNKILGYRNLNQLHERLQSLVIRRKKEEVISDLPEQVVNNYYIDLHQEQREMHAGYAQLLGPILNKKFLTPMDLRRMQELLLCMRMTCDSTYLIDRQTNISPKLKELEGIIQELVVESGRKMVIFSEWTTMTFLIARHLSDAGINFVELSGKIPVKKRQALIDEFTHNPNCRVFLSTDAGGTGLNLQAADCVVNFELPWNPAKMNQRIGRVNRIGQKSRCINVVNLITKGSIEEKILAGIQLKTELFDGVFDGGADAVEFSREKRTELLNQLREMMGEAPEPPPGNSAPPEEIPEDTPHYLNPEVLERAESSLDVTAEEFTAEADSGSRPGEDNGNAFAGQPPEKIEAVLNSGMQFIGGLIEMATGQKIKPAADDERMLSIDKDTGEVTLKFKMPGFG